MTVKRERIDKQHRYPWPVIEAAVRFYNSDNMTYRAISEKLSSSGVHVSHKTVYEWVQKFTSNVKNKSARRASAYSVEESHVKCNGEWCFLYRAHDKQNSTVGVHLRKSKNISSAKNFFKKTFASEE